MEIEKQILKLFAINEKLKFSEIESFLRLRSNKIAYHIKHLIEKQVLEKQEEFYKLSAAAEYLIPYLSEEKSPLVVLLIRLGSSKKCFLKERGKRPFKGKLSLPGGRLRVNETISDSVKRIMKEKYNIDAKYEKISSLHLELVKKQGKVIHSFLQVLVEAKTKDKIVFTEVDKNKSKILSSDYKIIKSKSKNIDIPLLISNLHP